MEDRPGMRLVVIGFLRKLSMEMPSIELIAKRVSRGEFTSWLLGQTFKSNTVFRLDNAIHFDLIPTTWKWRKVLIEKLCYYLPTAMRLQQFLRP